MEIVIKTLGGHDWKLGYTYAMPRVGDTLSFEQPEEFGMTIVRVVEVIHTVSANDFAEPPPLVIVAPIVNLSSGRLR
jgi:hypothetical protein